MSYETLENFRFTAHHGVSELNKMEGVPEAERLRLETDDVSSGQVTIKPRKEVKKEGKVDGMPGETTEKVPYRIDELPEKARKVVKAAYRSEIEVRATVTKWDQSDEPDTDGDETYYFIRDSHIDTINFGATDDEEEKVEQIEEDQEEEEDDEKEVDWLFDEEDEDGAEA